MSKSMLLTLYFSHAYHKAFSKKFVRQNLVALTLLEITTALHVHKIIPTLSNICFEREEREKMKCHNEILGYVNKNVPTSLDMDTPSMKRKLK